jgi:hypothetical protein
MEFFLNKNTGYCPSIVAYFKSVEIGKFSYPYYKLRHPGAIYNLMIGKLRDSFVLLATDIKEKRKDNIKSHFRLLLYDFFQFYESCYEIMICFCEKYASPTSAEQTHRWLEKNGYAVGKEFYESVKPLIRDLRHFYNEIKHSSNNIQVITFQNPDEITIGYFLDMPKEAYSGPLEPVSINLELRRIYYLIYFISEKLRWSLEKHIGRTYGISLNMSTEPIKDDVFNELYNCIQSLSDFFLLCEIGKSYLDASFSTDSLTFREKIIEEHALVLKHYDKGINFNMTFVVDGYNNTYTLPMCKMIQIGINFFYQRNDKSLRILRIIPAE